jgi:hypothetical protein
VAAVSQQGWRPDKDLPHAAQTPVKWGKRARGDSDAGSDAEDEGRPRRYMPLSVPLTSPPVSLLYCACFGMLTAIDDQRSRLNAPVWSATPAEIRHHPAPLLAAKVTASVGRRAIKFKEDLCPELKAKLERRPLATQVPGPPVSDKPSVPQIPVQRRPAEVHLGACILPG